MIITIMKDQLLQFRFGMRDLKNQTDEAMFHITNKEKIYILLLMLKRQQVILLCKMSIKFNATLGIN